MSKINLPKFALIYKNQKEMLSVITSTIASIFSYVVGFLYLARVIPSCIIGLAVFLPSIYKGDSYRDAFFYSLPFILAAVGGYALNDYSDAEKDQVNKPYRAIPSGRLSQTAVLRVSLICLSAAFFFAIFFAKTNIEEILYLLTIIGVASYNLFVKHLSLSKTFVTSVVSSFPLLFSVVAFHYPKTYLLLPAATVCFILGREWLMDIRDVLGDSQSNIVTIPMVIGKELTAKLGFLFQFLSVVLLVPIALYTQSYLSYFLLLSILLVIACSLPFWYSSAGKYQQQVIQYLWIPMLFGVMMLAGE